MKIEKRVYQEIIYGMPETPPEIGGIIGGKNNIITHYYIDGGISNANCCKCSYIPDTKWINTLISVWENNYIDFYGIFHCHFGGAKVLSSGDIFYIGKIMEKMPKRVKKLYFPIIVLPKREMIFYSCTLKDEKVNIEHENIEIF